MTAQLPHGYTLIELMIAITLTAILVTFGASSYFKAQQSQQIKTTSETILTVLTENQKKASSGTKDCDGPYLGQQLATAAGGNTLTATSVCESEVGASEAVIVSGVTFTSSHTFTFRPLGGGVELGAGTLNLDYTAGGDTYRIEIGSSGSIRNLGKIQE